MRELLLELGTPEEFEFLKLWKETVWRNAKNPFLKCRVNKNDIIGLIYNHDKQDLIMHEKHILDFLNFKFLIPYIQKIIGLPIQSFGIFTGSLPLED